MCQTKIQNEGLQTMENKITLDRVVLTFAFGAMLFMYSELDKKLDKVEYNRYRVDAKQTYKAIMKDQKEILRSLTELKTIVRLKHNVK